MNEQTRRECIKALAYGRSRDEVCAVMDVPMEALNDITEKEIIQQRNYLKKMGYMP
ncbi:hypothetical protein [Ruminococcus sp.]|uniref:hypothetical protein n=1 Tax=Ruminococcus sp. TaxID=41978 RepID=UPI002E806391|nr:hypothetical protein [Ruminococcus sp.]MEE3493082.1 hypothetical protein [Ruminococcus sp.]